MRLDTTTYIREHDRAPRGLGSWAFIMGAVDFDRLDEKDALGREVLWWAPAPLTFAAAKKLALAEARVRGVSVVGVAP